MKKGRFNIVIGGQAGSESKGKMALYLAEKVYPDLVVAAASPNAGHTVYIDRVKYVGYHLPVAALARGGINVCLGPTSIINIAILREEMGLLPTGKVRIHPRAAIIKYDYIEDEKHLTKIGSTNQGIGPCRAAKLMRDPNIILAKDVEEMHPFLDDTVARINYSISIGGVVLCEMSQGFDLDLEHGIDPRYCTSKMINPAMGMAEAGVSPKYVGDIYAVIRPYPIRVNNRDGSSGPYAEAREITWEEVEERSHSAVRIREITTTTKLPRRVFEFSYSRFMRMIEVVSPDFLCLQFANYISFSDLGKTNKKDLSKDTMAFIRNLENMGGVKVAYVGTSETTMIDMGVDKWE